MQEKKKFLGSFWGIFDRNTKKQRAAFRKGARLEKTFSSITSLS